MPRATAYNPGLSLADGLPSIRARVQYGKETAGVSEYRYDTVDRQRSNLALELVNVDIHDARADPGRFDLAINGFELYYHDSAHALAAGGDAATGAPADTLRDAYHEEMLPLIQTVSGTPHVVAQPNGFLIRHGKRSAIKTAARPASFAHCDYTPPSAEMMKSLIVEREGSKLPPFRHYAIYQTWRAVSPPPQDSLLTFCDGTTVKDEDCLIVKNVNGPEEIAGNVFFNKLGMARPVHRWFYYSELQPVDVILFMAHDSRETKQLNVLHTAFVNPLADERSVPRASVEARFVAFFE